MISHTINSIEKVIFQHWWVIFFFLFCYMSYEQGLRGRNREYAKLHQQLTALQEEKKEALALQEDLHLQVKSQNDPAWIELTLMKELGVVPENQTKVYFTTQE